MTSQHSSVVQPAVIAQKGAVSVLLRNASPLHVVASPHVGSASQHVVWQLEPVTVPEQKVGGDASFAEPGKQATTHFTARRMKGMFPVPRCHFEVSVGGKQPGFSGIADASTTEVVTGRFEVVGEVEQVGH